MSTRILIVDDNASLAEDLGEILEDEGYVCEVYSDAREVARLAPALRFDVALVDMRMPGLDGVGLQEVLRKSHPEARFLLMSAYSSDERVEQGLAAGAQCVLPKPVPLPSLLEALPPPHDAELLIVEDDRELAENLAEAMREWGYEVHVAHTCAEARARMHAGLGAAIVDLRLPDGSGLGISSEMFDMFGTPVVLISGYDPPAKAPPIRLLTKPFPPDALLRELHGLIPDRR